MPPANQAAKLPNSKQELQITTAPYPRLKSDQIVVKNAALAVNPMDWIIQDRGKMAVSHMEYPFTLGFDIAGEVVEVGQSVTRFAVGDRVVAYAPGLGKNIHDQAQSAFQLYTAVPEQTASKIPDSLPYEKAAVLPLGIMTAGASLFDEKQLNLAAPRPVKPELKGETVIIWGGSTSVGLNAVQLAVAAGYEVFTTCSPRNFPLLERLGAARVFDYNSPTIVHDIVTAMKGKTTAGAVALGVTAASALFDILDRCERGNKFIAMASYPVPQKPPKFFGTPYTILYFLSSMISYAIKSRTRGIGYRLVEVQGLLENGVGKELWQDFLGEALANGSFVPEPQPEVVGKGLEKLQEALEVQKEGVSAKKIVVTL
ncbi:hypothetical protein P175DRAFT_0470843 [Aspergillus ochraceoroseus IBT 24754]|uniref:Enoyl reductase (ER) domain-containing protein n=3 Tax=Aspergillus subgen. Nidulantes TaxID=2720870 RepID=A0A0F8WWQ7_9EURO|nr:uncharacterized protein P175DRAFT_0470843 [Aspergillus ochraceoroseus IBT 24754]KKK15757.1 hypothetical protein ARAM_004289 [Aspergillus rambellii]KKK21053.1 hypothetical protein AOCH_004847 [Aspergillus ochraceoroseus]PTU24594.1 hypothetical protein P175DRAFT_0470843 [Aspergillus ochraceoroseus IBT 24754]